MLRTRSFSFTGPPPPEIYTLSLHDALPISAVSPRKERAPRPRAAGALHALEPFMLTKRVISCLDVRDGKLAKRDRKSTRLNSSHVEISYAVFCLKKKKHMDRWPRP